MKHLSKFLLMLLMLVAWSPFADAKAPRAQQGDSTQISIVSVSTTPVLAGHVRNGSLAITNPSAAVVYVGHSPGSTEAAFTPGQVRTVIPWSNGSVYIWASAPVTGVTIDINPGLIANGWYNTKGLTNWYRSLSKVNGMGGTDVVVIGDSLTEGCRTSTYATGNWVYQLKKRLQLKYNPATVPGGFGYYPFVAGCLNSDWASVGSLATNGLDGLVPECFVESNWTANRKAYGAYALRYLDNRVTIGSRLRMDLPSSVFGSTDAELVYIRSGGTGNLSIDTSTTTGAFLTIAGAKGVVNSFNNTTDPNIGSTFVQYGNRFKVTGLTATSNLCFQVASSTGATANGARVQGLILYYGDYGAGVRVHNMAHFGTAYAADWGSPSGANQWANIYDFANEPPSTNTAVGAKRAGLFIFSLITNDVSNSPSQATLDTFYTRVKFLKDAAVSQNSKPSVLFVIPILRGGTYNAASYQQFVNVVKRVCDEDPTVCAMYSMWDDINQDVYSGLPTTYGWSVADSVHWTEGANSYLAQRLAYVL